MKPAYCSFCDADTDPAPGGECGSCGNRTARAPAAQPSGETVIFFREDMFYPLTLSGKVPTAEECADHAELNPETLRIEDLSGNVLWPEGTLQ